MGGDDGNKFIKQGIERRERNTSVNIHQPLQKLTTILTLHTQHKKL